MTRYTVTPYLPPQRCSVPLARARNEMRRRRKMRRRRRRRRRRTINTVTNI